MAQGNYAQRNEAVYNFLRDRGMAGGYSLSGGHLMPSGMGSGQGRLGDSAMRTAYGLYDLGLISPTGGLSGLGGTASTPVQGGMGDLRSMLPGDWQSYAGPLQGSLDLGRSLGREENLRRDQALELMRREGEIANQADRGMTEAEIAARLGRVSDTATGESMRQMKGLREGLGSAGVTGGGAAMGMAAGIELGRLGQITGGKRDIAIAEAERRSQAAANRYMRSMGQAQFMAQGPSTKEMESYNAVLDYLANIKLGEKNIEASKYAARQQAKAARSSGIGGIFGSLIGAILR